nr:hypothetical protein B0A51_18220 [Rachicladosporium sp. CCFEE 5018]
MSPHAMPPSPTASQISIGDSVANMKVDRNGIGRSNHSKTASKTSHLRHRSDSETQDLICAGFGPASLAVAVALHDAIDAEDPCLRTLDPKVRFLERQQYFAWHAGMLLPGAKMQISFLKDMATLRNPRSEFTFLNYLHRNDRLVAFTNLSTFLPQRIEYEDYMRWCADHFKDVVEYDQDVESVEPASTDSTTGAITSFRVLSANRTKGHRTERLAKHVLIAAGGRPRLPDWVPRHHPRIIHSSQYATTAHKLFPPDQPPRSIAVIGAGQSAAEVFHNLPSRFLGCKSHLLVRGSALRPSDDSPFVNEVFDPERVDDYYCQDPTVRAEAIAQDKATNYGVVRIELLEEIYASLYSQRIQYPSDAQWPQRILNHRTISHVEDLPSSNPSSDSPRLRLHIHNASSAFQATPSPQLETLDVDLVIVASGYLRNAHEEILAPLAHLRPSGNAGSWQVARDYRVQFREGAVSDDAGVWLQGCNESTHGLSDTLLSILAVRGGEVVESIFGQKAANGKAR